MANIDNRKAVIADIYHIKGNVLDEEWTIKNSSGDPYNLQNKSIVMTIFEDTADKKTAETLSTAAGTLAVSGDNYENLAFNKVVSLTYSKYRYQIDIVTDNLTLALGYFYETDKK